MKKSKKKYWAEIGSYGLYTKWDKEGRELPKIVEFTNIIKADEGNELGMILKYLKGKGVKLLAIFSHFVF